MRRGDSRNYYKGHMDKIKGEGRDEGGTWVRLGWWGGLGGKGRKLYLNNNNNNKKTDTI